MSRSSPTTIQSISTIGIQNAGKGYPMSVAVFDSNQGSDIKSLLNGTSNALLTLQAGAFVFDVIMYTSTPAGSVATCNIGTDASFSIASDADAFITALDCNAGGQERTTIAGNAGNSGVSATGANANILIQSSADISASAWAGGVIVLFQSA